MRPRQPAAAPLEPDVVAILLGGWLAEPPGGRERQAGFTPGTLDVFSGNLPRVAELWHQHEAFLRAEARRVGVAPEFILPGGAVGFFGEYAV